MQYFRKLTLALPLLIAGLIGCGGSVPLKDSSGQDMVGKVAYTQHVLRPDRTRGRLYTLNYQLPDAPMPICTKVKITEINRKVMVFTEVDSGREYHYFYHKATGEPIEQAAAETFGLSCNDAAVKKLSKKDREGIEKGQILKGMSKEGVLLAAGKPPAHRTPNTDYDQWTYWKNRWATMVVHFNEKGVVDRIVE